jgi:hypothetical protein
MNRKRLLIIGLIVALVVLIVATVSFAGRDELANVRKVTAQFQQVEAAQVAGYDLRPILDHCFNNPGVGAMGYHYIDTSILDLALNELEPEAMVYAPGPEGQLQLAAVEYIVPAADWDAAGNTEPPSLLGHHLHLNKDLGVYVLHAWIWQDNPAGVFEDWNPEVSCPKPEM